MYSNEQDQFIIMNEAFRTVISRWTMDRKHLWRLLSTGFVFYFRRPLVTSGGCAVPENRWTTFGNEPNYFQRKDNPVMFGCSPLPITISSIHLFSNPPFEILGQPVHCFLQTPQKLHRDSR